MGGRRSDIEVQRYFEVLELEPNASPRQLKRAYRDMSQVWHPDRFKHDPRLYSMAEERMKEINEAYSYLRSAHSWHRFEGSQRRHRPRATSESRRRQDVSLGLVEIAYFVAGTAIMLIAYRLFRFWSTALVPFVIYWLRGMYKRHKAA